jgi:hypothetical protein
LVDSSTFITICFYEVIQTGFFCVLCFLNKDDGFEQRGCSLKNRKKKKNAQVWNYSGIEALKRREEGRKKRIQKQTNSHKSFQPFCLRENRTDRVKMLIEQKETEQRQQQIIQSSGRQFVQLNRRLHHRRRQLKLRSP